jgi:hypothetical protein
MFLLIIKILILFLKLQRHILPATRMYILSLNNVINTYSNICKKLYKWNAGIFESMGFPIYKIYQVFNENVNIKD